MTTSSAANLHKAESLAPPLLGTLSARYTLARRLASPAARLVLRPVVEGRRHVPRHGPVILASNHRSFIDSVVIPLVAPRPVTFLAKAEYFEGDGLKGAAMRAFFQAVGAVPVRREHQRDALGSLKVALRVLQSGGAFGIYPEGTRSRDGRLYRGRTGVGWLALRSGAPVVPVGLIGTDRLLPVGARFPRLARVTVRFGEPLDFSDVETSRSASARREITDMIMDRIQQLSGQLTAGSYNTPTANEGD